MVKITDNIQPKKNIAYWQDIICNNPLAKEQLSQDSLYEIIDQRSDDDNLN